MKAFKEGITRQIGRMIPFLNLKNIGAVILKLLENIIRNKKVSGASPEGDVGLIGAVKVGAAAV